MDKIKAINIADYLTINLYGSPLEIADPSSKIVDLPVPGYTISLASVVYLPVDTYTVKLRLPHTATPYRVLWEGAEKSLTFFNSWRVTLPGNNRREFGNLLQVEWSFPTHGNKVVNMRDWSISHKEQNQVAKNLYTIRFAVAENKPITIGNVRILA